MMILKGKSGIYHNAKLQTPNSKRNVENKPQHLTCIFEVRLISCSHNPLLRVYMPLKYHDDPIMYFKAKNRLYDTYK